MAARRCIGSICPWVQYGFGGRHGKALDYLLTGGASNIWRQALAGGPPKQITNFKSDLIFSFDWSRDGKQLALARGATSSDVILISNF